MTSYTSFSEFYKMYLCEHSHPFNRLLHHIGTLMFLLFLLLAFWTHIFFLLFIGIGLGYGFAWLGHFKIEKNTPTTFRAPIYSLLSDFRMLYDFFTFQLDQKVQEALDSRND